MKFAICNEQFTNWDFTRIIKFIAATGYQGIEIAPYTFSESVTSIPIAKRREIRMIAADAGIVITGLHWLLVKPVGLHLNHLDRIIRERTVDYLKHLIDFCADIGGTIMVFGSPNQRNILPELGYEQGKQLALESLAVCAPLAQNQGVTICMEALPEQQTNFLNTNAEVLSFIRELNHPNVQMVVDIKSMCSETMPVPDNIRACQGFFRHVHANDVNLKGPGFGAVDFRPIFQTLIALNYEGFVSVEAFDYLPDPETIAVQSLHYMQNCLEGIKEGEEK